jgi:hypothetical protein
MAVLESPLFRTVPAYLRSLTGYLFSDWTRLTNMTDSTSISEDFNGLLNIVDTLRIRVNIAGHIALLDKVDDLREFKEMRRVRFPIINRLLEFFADFRAMIHGLKKDLIYLEFCIYCQSPTSVAQSVPRQWTSQLSAEDVEAFLTGCDTPRMLEPVRDIQSARELRLCLRRPRPDPVLVASTLIPQVLPEHMLQPNTWTDACVTRRVHRPRPDPVLVASTDTTRRVKVEKNIRRYSPTPPVPNPNRYCDDFCIPSCTPRCLMHQSSPVEPSSPRALSALSDAPVVTCGAHIVHSALADVERHKII